MKSTLIGIAVAVVTAIVTAIIMSLGSSVSEGQDALSDAHIRQIAAEEVRAAMVTDSGLTQGQLLVQMNATLIEIQTNQANMKEALQTLAAE